MAKRDVPSPNENVAPAVINNNNDMPETPVAKRARIENEDRIAVAGRVASVKLHNFMCHANLLIEFNTKANNCFYIGGPNGSGKSALFAAINLGLGGRGSDNDRGNTVKSYIKDGTTQAKITITLTNGGLNAHPDFDDLISVERTINQSASTYVMKSIRISSSGCHSERIISKRKGDIDRIISRFNIHLSNPAFWMSQDRSRSFLANFKPANVYKLYLESTNLEKILHSYQRFADSLRDCREIVRIKTDEVKNEADQLKRMQEQQELNQKIEADKLLISVYMWKLLFCRIRDADDLVRVNDKKMELQKKLHATIKAEYQKNRTERTTIENEAQDLAEQVEALKMEMDEYNTQLDEINTEYAKYDHKQKAIHQDIRMKKIEKKAAEDEISKAQKDVRALMEKKGSEELTIELKKVEEQYESISKEREEMETGDDLQKLRDRLDMVEADFKREDDAKYDMVAHIGNLRRKAEKNTDMLRRSKAMKKDTINKFGSQMADILQEINRNQSKFDQLPKGPLGKFITLKDQKWAYPVEECLKSYANQFLCSTQRDADTLRKIFHNLRLDNRDRPTIIVCRFLGHRHSGLQEPSDEFETIFRILDFSDPDVHNAIIDKSGCESVLLITDKMDAMNLMRENPPHNAHKAYVLDGSQVHAGHPYGQYRFYSGSKGRPMGLFGSSHQEVDEVELDREIKSAKAEVGRLEAGELRELEAKVKELRMEKERSKKTIDSFEQKLVQLRGQELKAERAMKDLRKRVADSAKEDMIDNLNDGIEEMQNKVPQMEEAIGGLEQDLKANKTEMQPILDRKREQEKMIDAGRKENKEFLIQIRELQGKLGSYDEKGDVLKSRLTKLANDEHVLYHDEARLKTERDEVVARVETDKANKVKPDSEQDPPDLTDFPPTDVAERKLRELQKSVNRATAGCDQTITLDSIKDFKEQLKKRRYYCRMCDNVIDNLEEVQTARLNVYPLLKKYTEMKVCDKFQDLLAVRGHFIGGLEFDHEKQTLNVNVQSCKEKDAMISSSQRAAIEEDDYSDEEEEDEESGDDDEPRRKRAKKQKKKTKRKARDLKGLSGGERSFVTAALVMSLWEVMEQPFRMMDEFDVFMDMMNRKLVMDLLVELATKKFPHNQFIFFTPQGIKELKMVDGLQVFEMNKVRD